MTTAVLYSKTRSTFSHFGMKQNPTFRMRMEMSTTLKTNRSSTGENPVGIDDTDPELRIPPRPEHSSSQSLGVICSPDQFGTGPALNDQWTMATVFYVDDNARSRRLLSSVLTECGFEVITAADPVEALPLCKRLSFDLALLDYQMPSLTGSQLAREIKFFSPHIPVVLISDYTVLPTSELMFVDAHFGRGTSLDDLLETMRRLTNSKPSSGINRRSVTSWPDST
jgi:CheY-like chemotaxis protein